VPSKKSETGQDTGALVLPELREAKEFVGHFRFSVILENEGGGLPTVRVKK
jgi:hypothetical protein